MEANGIISILDLVSYADSYVSQALLQILQLSESLQDCEEKSPNKPPFAINFLEYSKARETFTSWIIRHIFAYTHNGRHPFFESFASTFLREIGFKMEWIEVPVINKDHEYNNIDILVREDKKYAVIIENKLKGAPFQPNQLARYIAKMSKEGFSYERIFVVVLPDTKYSNEDLPTSAWNLPKDWKASNSKRKCIIDQYSCWCDYEDYQPKHHCSYCRQFKEPFHDRTLFIHKEFSEWLYGCVVNNTIDLPKEEFRKQYVLTSAILQFVDFLNSLYQTRENNKYKMDIHKFLSQQLNLGAVAIDDQLALLEDKKKDVEELGNRLNELYNAKLKEYINKMCERYHIHVKYEDKNDWYFHYDFNFDGTTVSVVLGYEKEEKSAYCQIETRQRRKIPEIIRNDFDIFEELNDKDNRNDCIWRYDSYKESLLRFDRVLGKLRELQAKE